MLNMELNMMLIVLMKFTYIRPSWTLQQIKWTGPEQLALSAHNAFDRVFFNCIWRRQISLCKSWWLWEVLDKSEAFTAQKIKFSIKDFFSKCDQIRRKLRICSHLLKKSLMENFIFRAVIGFVKTLSLPSGNDLLYLLVPLPQEIQELSYNFPLIFIRWHIFSLFIV